MRQEARTRRRLSGAAPALLGLLAAAGCRPAPPAVEFTTVRGHSELRLDGGRVTPVLFQREEPLGLCFRVAPETDTSTWEGTVELGSKPGRGFTADARLIRMGTRSLCLEKTFTPAEAGRTELCAALRDRWRKKLLLPPFCRPVEVLALGDPGPEKFLPEGLRLVEIHTLLRNGTTLAQVDREIARSPAWLDLPEASELAGQREHLAALAQMDLGGSLVEASERLRRAEEAYERIASPTWLDVRRLQADILSRGGATEQAIDRLRRTRESCRTLPCEPALLPALHNDLAWHILLRPDALPAELAEAEGELRLALERTDERAEPETAANRHINLAYLAARRGHDPAAELAEARQLLGRVADGERRGQLLAWADLVLAYGALAAGDPGRALALCRPLAEGPELRDRLLLARAASCAGEAYDRLEDLAPAEASYGRALAWHERATAGGPLDAPLGSGQRADDFYRAAFLAARRGDPGRSLAILDRLDALAGEATRRCIERLRPRDRDRHRDLQRRRDELLAGDRALAAAAAGDGDPAVAPLRTRLKEKMQDLAWQLAALCPPESPAAPAAVDVRAVPLPEGVLLLTSGPGSRVSFRFTPIPRAELVARLAEIDRAFGAFEEGGATGRLDGLDELARLLLPAEIPRRPGALTFALYGVLQAVPLQALPVETPGGRKLLADLVTVALHPAAVNPAAAPARSGAEGARRAGPKALFLVNPTLDLADAGAAAFYRRRFPAATVLEGEAARRAALDSAGGLELLHFDGHGELDPAFPELSRIFLADGPLTLSQIPELRLPARLVNLSGCETGRFPVTADSGRYGLAGAFARLGTPWVVASRNRLDDRLAHDFNRAFYDRLAAGAGVPESYGAALAQVRRHHPPAAWAGLLLLADGRGEGQTPSPRTPG